MKVIKLRVYLEITVFFLFFNFNLKKFFLFFQIIVRNQVFAEFIFGSKVLLLMNVIIIVFFFILHLATFKERERENICFSLVNVDQGETRDSF